MTTKFCRNHYAQCTNYAKNNLFFRWHCNDFSDIRAPLDRCCFLSLRPLMCCAYMYLKLNALTYVPPRICILNANASSVLNLVKYIYIRVWYREHFLIWQRWLWKKKKTEIIHTIVRGFATLLHRGSGPRSSRLLLSHSPALALLFRVSHVCSQPHR